MSGLLSNAYLRLLLGAALISFSPVFVALVSVSATSSAFWRVALGGSILLGWLVLRGSLRRMRRVVWAMCGAAAVFFALDLWFWHQSILYVGPGLATLLANFQVFVMTAAGLLLLGQRPTPSQLIAIPLAVLGLGLIVGIDWSALPGDYRLGIVFGLLTAVAYSGYILSFRQVQALEHLNARTLPAQELAIVSLMTALLLAVTAGVEGESLAIVSLSDGLWLSAYAVLAHILGWLMIASSLSHVPAALVGLSLLLQPLLSFIWDVLFFGREVSSREATGAAIALAAIYLGSRGRARRQRSAA